MFGGALALVGCDNDSTTADAGPNPDTDSGPAPATCVDVVDDITASTTWDQPCYILRDIIFVSGESPANPTILTINAGVEILGSKTPNSDATTALIIGTSGRINAVGTAESPIVFSSAAAIGSRAAGDWGGVALLGTADINSGDTEGLKGLVPGEEFGQYGGSDDTHDCGTLQYVRIEFASFAVAEDEELNGLTLAGCGSQTTISHVQVHRAEDDGIEMFGGTANLDHIIISGPNDDGLDWDLGWRGHGQFIVVHQFNTTQVDNGFEADNLGSDESATPLSRPTLYNVTMIGAVSGEKTTRAALFKEGTGGIMRNMIITGFQLPPDVASAQIDPNTLWPTDFAIENTYFFENGDFPATEQTEATAFDESAAFMAAERNNSFTTDVMLGTVSETAPNYVPGAALPGTDTFPTGSNFFDTTADFAGAFEMGGTDWSAGWTSYPVN